jgi:hypothetical protein
MATNKQQSKYCWAVMMEIMFSLGSDPRLYNQNPRLAELRVLPSAWGYNRATLFLGDINTGTWSQI